MARKDINQTSFMIAAIATGEIPNPEHKNGVTVNRARKAGKVGGVVRNEKLTAKEKVEIANKGAKARWGK